MAAFFCEINLFYNTIRNTFDSMKKTLSYLMKLCPGRVGITIDHHKLFNETAQAVIAREKYFNETCIEVIEKMIELNTIIQIDAVPVDKPMPLVTVYHYDIELGLKETLKQIKEWKP